jgi:hypothetical protein
MYNTQRVAGRMKKGSTLEQELQRAYEAGFHDCLKRQYPSKEHRLRRAYLIRILRSES